MHEHKLKLQQTLQASLKCLRFRVSALGENELNGFCVAKSNQECWANIFPRRNQWVLTNTPFSELPFHHFSSAITSPRHIFWFPSFMCIQMVIVNIIYFPLSLPGALITLTGSFNWINNLLVLAHTLTHTHSRLQTQNFAIFHQLSPCSHELTSWLASNLRECDLPSFLQIFNKKHLAQMKRSTD